MLNKNSSPLSSMTFVRALGLSALAAVSMNLAGCGTRPDMESTGSIRNDYRKQHPINLAEVEHNLDVPLGAGERGLTPAARDLIRGFAQDYNALSKSTLAIALPESAANSRAAHAQRLQVRKVLVGAGIPNARIVTTTYPTDGGNASAPIRLSFVAVTAITDDCGQWPSDLFGKSVMDNTNWENFGCATQQNLAAQIANPVDLVGPRGMTPIDAQRRAEVIRIYREGE